MINTVAIVGRLTKDPELRKTQSGISVLQFTVAVQRPYADSNGNRGADFISCVAWRKAAENISTYFKKGNSIGLEGRLQSRSYDSKEGNRIFITELLVERFSFIESKKEREASSNSSAQPAQSAAPAEPKANDDLKQATQKVQDASKSASDPVDPFAGNGDLDISNDDLPF